MPQISFTDDEIIKLKFLIGIINPGTKEKYKIIKGKNNIKYV